jgi:NAD(P)-dependent dehydrogenase (short-subunit alcohol dehydrogenase family)
LEIVMNLNDKIALITGSTRGIGAATARALAGEGAHVIVAGRDEARGQSVVDSIPAGGGTADFVAAELRDERSARALATAALQIAGRVDILVNNAAIGAFGSTASTTEEEFDDTYSSMTRTQLTSRCRSSSSPRSRRRWRNGARV